MSGAGAGGGGYRPSIADQVPGWLFNLVGSILGKRQGSWEVQGREKW